MCHSFELLFKYAMNEEGMGTVPEAFQEIGINNLSLDCFYATPVIFIKFLASTLYYCFISTS